MGVLQTTADIPVEHQKNVFGPFDSYLKKIESKLGVTIVMRENDIKVIGPEKSIDAAKRVLYTLTEMSKRGNEITEQNVDYCLSMSFKNDEDKLLKLDEDMVCRTAFGKPIKPKTVVQKQYVDAIRKDMIVFGVGPAGTGKTYLGMAMAIQAFKENQVSRIILTRPAIEAGEKLGFLPGDLQSKVDPYLRPLYDALYEIMGADSFNHNMEKGLIEVAPLAYMRGRTLDNSFIILDEAQNTTPAQMKMFLTRIGFGSKVIVTGDLTQKDLPYGTRSGLDDALTILRNIDEISIIKFTNADVVRHPLVQRIVEAYEKYESKENRDKHDNRDRRDNKQAGKKQDPQ